MKIISKTGGYTIIETMVSVAIFLIVVEFGMGSLLGANAAHRKSRDMRSIIDSLNFVMEDLSRNIRTGYTYKCFRKTFDTTLSPATLAASPSTRSCRDGWAIALEYDIGDPTTNNDQWAYYINAGKIWKSTNGAANFFQLTPDEVVINSSSGFSVLGAEPPTGPNRQQPFITIRLVGTINYKGTITPFSLQTSTSQRLIDI